MSDKFYLVQQHHPTFVSCRLYELDDEPQSMRWQVPNLGGTESVALILAYCPQRPLYRLNDNSVTRPEVFYLAVHLQVVGTFVD